MKIKSKVSIEQFKLNMNAVVKKIRNKNVPFIFSEAVSNLSGNPPFNSAKVEGFPTAIEAYLNK